MPGVRHHVVSILLFLVLWSGSVGVVGLAQAGEEFPGTRIEIRDMMLPAPRIGDTWVYELIDRNEDAEREREVDGGDESVSVRYRWAEPRVAVDAEGVFHAVNVMRLSYDSDDRHERMFDAATAIMVGSSSHGEHESESPVLLPAVTARSAGYGVTQTPVPFGWTYANCFSPVVFREPLRVADGFDLPSCIGLGMFDEPMAFRFVAGYAVDGHRYAVFDRSSQAPADGGVIDRIVLRDDVPYPVEMTVSVRETADDFEGIIAYRMTSFERGDQPLPATATRDLPALPRLRSEPASWQGIPDSDVDHPFPFSAAMDAARRDVGDDTVRVFLDEHPDAVVAHTDFYAIIGDGSAEYVWDFRLLGNGEELPSCEVARQEPSVRAPPLVLEPPLGGRGVVTVECEPAKPTDEPLLPALDVAPAADSLLAAWAAYAEVMGHDVGTPAYVIDRYWYEGAPSVRYGVSVTEFRAPEASRTGAVVGPLEHQYVQHVIWFDSAGHLTRITAGASSYSMAVEPGPGPSTEPASFALTSGAKASWAVPDKATVAAASLLALFIAALYWLFPFLKQLPLLGMFSRIQRDGALDHPTRAAIVEAVSNEPGIHDRELQRRLGVARGALQHHVRKLLDHQLVVRRRESGFTRYWPPDAAGQPVPLEGTARQVHELLSEDPGLSQSELARRLGVSRQAVGKHVVRLRAAGMLPAN